MYYLNLCWTVRVHILGYLAAIKEGITRGQQLVFYKEPFRTKLFIHVHETVIDFITKGFNSNRSFAKKWTRTSWEYHKTKKDGAMVFKKELIEITTGSKIMAFQRKKPKTDGDGKIIYEKGTIKFKKRPYYSLYGDHELITDFFKSLL